MNARRFSMVVGALLLVSMVAGPGPAWGQPRQPQPRPQDEQQVQILLNAVQAGAAAPKAKPDGAVGSLGEYALSEPLVHKNLTVFMVYGKDRIAGKEFLTLREALERKLVTVHETGNVSTLTIENRSDHPIYVQSGEIVKGGKQDRTLRYDLIVPPKSGKVPLLSFCVERGRWSRRGNETVALFAASSDMLNTKGLKLAAKGAGNNQGAVWKEVANAQGTISSNIGQAVNSAASPSSLQLSLENKEYRKAVDEYVGALSKAAEGKRNAIGLAFAINGEVNSIDVYASGALFRKLWPKLLKASAGEAVAEQKKGRTHPAAKAEDVRKLIAEMAKQKAVARSLSKRTRFRTSENAAAAYFETVDESLDGAPIHKNYVKK